MRRRKEFSKNIRSDLELLPQIAKKQESKSRIHKNYNHSPIYKDDDYIELNRMDYVQLNNTMKPFKENDTNTVYSNDTYNTNNNSIYSNTTSIFSNRDKYPNMKLYIPNRKL